MPVVVSLAQGGTGANSSSAALTALGAAPVAAYAQANTALTAANSVVKVSSLVYPGNDTAANNIGGQTMYINGSGFASNSTVYINGNAAPSVSFISSSNLSFTTPNIANGIYPVYVINPADGATAIFIPGMVVSSEPSWVTSASLSDVNATDAWNISLSATGDAPITYALAAGSSLPSGISLASNGVISGTLSSPPESDTTYNFTAIATDAQNQDASRAFSVTATVGEGLPFANNVLLIHADGTNNKNNHHFLDSSNNNFTITRSNNVTQGSFSPFSQTGWSGYFDGSGDGISFGSNVNTNPASSDITVEAWIYPLAYNSYGPIFSNDVNGGFHFGKIASGFGVRHYGTGDVVFTATTPSLNQWTHVAVSRSGNSWYLFYNGTQVATATASNSFTQGTACVGGNASTAAEAWNGYLSNVRFVKGTALYTSNFTPSTTPLTAVSNTQLLTCQNNRFVDNSSNAYAVTVFGTPSIQAFSPFNPTAAWSAATNGGSGYFDGSGDNLTTPTVSAFQFGSGDFTVEMWVYMTVPTGTRRHLFHTGTNNSGQFNFRIEPSGQLLVFANESVPFLLAGSTSLTAGQWYHVAFSREGSTNRIFVNGAVDATATNSYSYTGSGNVQVGYWVSDSSEFAGYLSSLRVVKGTAVYTGAFTPPTAPVTAITNTSFLLNFTNAGIFDQTAKNVLETVGDAKVSTAQYKYGTGSIVLDGTGDRLIAPNNPLFAFGTGPFTIEAWVNRSASGSVIHFIDFRGSNNNGSNPVFYWQTNNYIYYTNDNTSGDNQIQSSNAITSSSGWVHLAIVRSGTTLTVYVNGVASGSTTYLTNILGGNPVTIGNRYNNSGAYNGYIDDLRISRFARYTSNFTPPTSALKDK